jgi:hypothetical protein
MSDRSPAMIKVTREAPCDGRREELLSLAALRSDARTSPAVMRHLRTCRRCKAFLHSVQGELRLARDAFSNLDDADNDRGRHPRLAGSETADPAGASLASLPTSRTFEQWLDRQLRDRTELKLAEAMTRTARWLHRLDPKVAARTVDLSESARPAGAPPPTAFDFAAELERSMAWRSSACRSSRTRRRTEPPSDFELVEAIRRFAASDAMAHAGFARLASALLERANDLAGGKLGATFEVRAIVRWFHDDVSGAAADLQQAIACRNSCQGSLLYNLALLRYEADGDPSHFRLLARAIECSPRVEARRTMLLTRLVWNASLGRFSAMERDAGMIANMHQLSSARCQVTPAKLEESLRFLVARFAIPEMQTKRAIRRSLETLHGT